MSIGSWFCFVPMQEVTTRGRIGRENGFRSVGLFCLSESERWVCPQAESSKLSYSWWFYGFLSMMSASQNRSSCFRFALPATWKINDKSGALRHSQCENAQLICSSLYLPAGQFKHHLCNEGIWKGQVRGLPKPLFSPNWARRPTCLPENI